MSLAVNGSVKIRTRGLKPKRYPIQTAVRFRGADGRWHSGVTESVSKSGILLRADESPEPDTPIELELELPQLRGEETAGRVICRGRVVRIDTMCDQPRPGIVAATIAQYQFRR
jgi:hypothetical protein